MIMCYLQHTCYRNWDKFHPDPTGSESKALPLPSYLGINAQAPNKRKMCYTGNPLNNDLQLSGSYGTLQSPQEPNYYPSGASCDWLITVPVGKIVKLKFDSFELEPTYGSECTADYVEILDGRYSSSKSKGRFCGFLTPNDVRCSDRYMWVRFRADTAKSYYDGFKATYTAEDKPTSNSTALIIGIVVGVIVFIAIVCCVVCVVKNKKPSGGAGAAIPMSTTTATHASQPGVIQHPPNPTFQPPYQPPVNPYPPPPVAYAPVPTNPPPPAAPNPYPPYSPQSPPPPYPGDETVPQYPPPGQSYPWLQSAPAKASAPPESL